MDSCLEPRKEPRDLRCAPTCPTRGAVPGMQMVVSGRKERSLERSPRDDAPAVKALCNSCSFQRADP